MRPVILYIINGNSRQDLGIKVEKEYCHFCRGLIILFKITQTNSNLTP